LGFPNRVLRTWSHRVVFNDWSASEPLSFTTAGGKIQASRYAVGRRLSCLMSADHKGFFDFNIKTVLEYFQIH